MKKVNRVIDFFVARPGFEPRQTEPKSVVLPLYYRARSPFCKSGRKFNQSIPEYKQRFDSDQNYSQNSSRLFCEPLKFNKMRLSHFL